MTDDENYEVVKPPTDLRKKVRILSPREAKKFDPVKAAETALARLAQNFDGWMTSSAKDLHDAYGLLEAQGINAGTVDGLYQAAHNLKGQAATLGYPLVGEVAGSLCYLIEEVPSPSDLPKALLAQYVDAIRAMVSENARDQDNAVGTALLTKLNEVTNDYLSRVRQIG
ncbi:Hpt domain-containing protein [Roseibium litorale]|uniref:Hpt domain-containing protein n=1 Tax=Roseibium litorale TaxID=2803841 RepID=UPI001AD94017|nr:Hpt domain-containing protein [Roseibium litorale]